MQSFALPVHFDTVVEEDNEDNDDNSSGEGSAISDETPLETDELLLCNTNTSDNKYCCKSIIL